MEIITCGCSRCHQHYFIPVQSEDWAKYETGRYRVQDCFPYLTPDERELFISGICGDCFNEIFGEDEEE